MELDSIAGVLIGLLFVAYGSFSLLVLFNPKVRLWFLKRSERKRWRRMPFKTSSIRERRSLDEGLLLAASIVTALIALPLGLLMLLVYFKQIIQLVLK